MTEKASGGQPGNDNAKRGTEVRQALRRSICAVGQAMKESEGWKPDDLTNYERGLGSISTNLLFGSKEAIAVFNTVADRMDGKPVQQIQADVKTESKLIIRD